MPDLSVVFCTCARQASLLVAVRAALDDLETCGAPAEVLVVDDGALPGTFVDDLSRLSAERGVAFAYVRKEPSERGLYASRRTGVARARGEVVLFLDDDAEVGPGYCRSVLARFRDDPGVAGVGGVDAANLPLGLPAGGAAYARFFLLAGAGPGALSRSGMNHGQASWRLQRSPFASDYLHGCNMAFRREALATLPRHAWLAGHSPCEDLVLSRVAAASGRLVVDPSLPVRHECAPGGRGDRRQRMRARITAHRRFAEAYLPRSRGAFAWSALGLMVKDALKVPTVPGLRDVLAAYGSACADVFRERAR